MRRGKNAPKETVWAEWLSDEPLPPRVAMGQPGQFADSETLAAPTPLRSAPPAAARERLRNAGATPPAPQPSIPQEGLSIQISMPSFRRPTWVPRLGALPWRQIKSYALVGAVCMVLAVGTRAALELAPNNNGAKQQDVKGAATTDAGPDAKPTYAPIVPESKKDLATPGQGKGSFDASRQMYVYNDTLNGANLVVSQQPVPKEVTADGAQLAKIAASVGAKQSFATAFGEAYMSQKEESGEQIVVFMYQERLLFIRSDKRFDSESWKFYIESLRKSE